MPKDTKTLGNSKARACESLGFVHKKGCARVLTQPRKIWKMVMYYKYYYSFPQRSVLFPLFFLHSWRHLCIITLFIIGFNLRPALSGMAGTAVALF